MAPDKSTTTEAQLLTALFNLATSGATQAIQKTDTGFANVDISSSSGGANAALSNLSSVAINTSLLPGTNDGAALGTATFSFSDLFLASGGVINWNNGNVTETQSSAALSFNGTSGVDVTINGTPAGTTLTIAGTGNGVGINASGVTNGVAFRAIALVNSGIGLDVTCTSGTGQGFRFNTTSVTATSASAIQITGSANMTNDYTGNVIYLDTTKSITANATRNVSGVGNMLSIAPTYSITGAQPSIHNMSGATVNFSRTILNSSSNGSSSLNVSGALVAITNTKSTATSPIVDTGILLDINQNNATGSGLTLNVNNTGTGNLALFSGTGNVGIGTGTTISAKLHVTTTTEQLRLGYDSSNFTSFTVGSTGLLTISKQVTAPQIINTSNALTASANAATVPITSRITTVTNNSAATLTITITTSGAVDGQLVMVRVLDFSAVAQSITWVNTENSTATVPTTSNGSTTLPLTVGFQYNNATSKWRCIASS